MSDTTRSAVNSSYKFDLSHIFAEPDDWDRSYRSLADTIDSITAFEEPIESIDALESLIELVLESFATGGRLELYAALRQKITDDPAATERLERYRSIEGDLEFALSHVDQLLQASCPELFDRFAEHRPALASYVQNLRAQASHRRSRAEEELLSSVDSACTAPNRIIRSIKNDAFESPTITDPDGETHRLDYSGYFTAMNSTDRIFRRRCYETYFGALEPHSGPLYQAYAEKIRTLSSLAAVRHYDSLCEAQLRKRCFPENGTRQLLDPAVHATLVESIQEHLEPYHRWQALRAERLGVDTLRPWDLRAPLIATEPPTIPYETAIEHVIASLAPLGKSYQEQARRFFEDDRADVKPHAGRNNAIGYCHSSIADGPFVLCNYADTFRSMVTIAHELGHALAIEQIRDRPLQETAAPRAVEEIPSVTHELLLYRYCIDQGGLLGEYGAVHRADSIGGLLFDQARYAAFVRTLVDRVESDRQLTRAFADDRYLELHTAFSPTVEFVEESRLEWLNRNIQRDPFHHYQYVLGAVGGLVVADRVRSGSWSNNEYRQLLIDMGRHSATELFESIGLDITTPAPYQTAVDAFEPFVAKLA